MLRTGRSGGKPGPGPECYAGVKMLSFQTRHARWILWLLALSALCFLASQFPELRARLPWRERPAPEAR